MKKARSGHETADDRDAAPVRLSCCGGIVAGPRAFFRWLVGCSVNRVTVTEFVAHIEEAGREAFRSAACVAGDATKTDAVHQEAEAPCAVLVLTGAEGDVRHYIPAFTATAHPGERDITFTEYSFETEGRMLEHKAHAQAAVDVLAASVSHDLGNLITLLKAGHEQVMGEHDAASREIWATALRKLLLLNDTLAFGYGPGQPVAPVQGDLLRAVKRNALLVEMSYDVKIHIDCAGRLQPVCGAAQECIEAAVYMALLATVRAAGPQGAVRVKLAAPAAADETASDRVTAHFEPLGNHCAPVLVHDLLGAQPGGSTMHKFGAAEAMAIAANSGGRCMLAPNSRAVILSWPRWPGGRDSAAPARRRTQHFIVAGAPDISNAACAALRRIATRVRTYPSVTDALTNADGMLDAVWIAEIRSDWSQAPTASALRRLCDANRPGFIAIARTGRHARYAAATYPGMTRVLQWPVPHDDLELALRQTGKA